MNPSHNHRDSLLDDLLPASGPGCQAILEVVRHEHVRRQRRRRLQVATSVVALTTLLLMRPRPAPELAPATAAAPELLVIRSVNDRELLAMLDGVPAAVMQWPDGSRTLLVLENAAAR